MSATEESTASPPYAGLTPDLVLNAIDSAGLRTSGTLLSLNSYENRVFQVGIEDEAPVVAKFYRPGRWSDAQILEEHAFITELAGFEIPAVVPLELNGRSLNAFEDFRFAIFARRGGRAPNLDDQSVLEWLGRFLGRLHAVGAIHAFATRPTLDIESFGREPLNYVMTHDWLPADLRDVYAGVARHALAEVERCTERAGAIATIRLHGDVHEGNVLWADSAGQVGPHFIDFDDSRSGPAVQDLWMLLGADRDEQMRRLAALVDGYEEFRDFDRRELHLIEALRTLRLLHYSAWIARRWHDPAFPAAFPWFGEARYWEARVLELREQIAAMQEPALVV